MVKLTKTERSKFDKKLNKIFDTLDFKPDELRLNGSFVNKIQALYSGDIDFYEPIKLKQLSKWYKKTYKDIIEEFGSNLLELKIGNDKYKTFPSFDTIKDKLQTTDTKRIKIDVYEVINDFPTEITVIYDFSTKAKTDDEVYKELVHKIIEEYDDGNYYKMFKRIYSIQKLRGHIIPELNEILQDPLLGKLHQTVAHLNLLLKLKPEDSKLYLDIIKEILRKLGLSRMYRPNNIESMKMNLQGYLNKATYHKYMKLDVMKYMKQK